MIGAVWTPLDMRGSNPDNRFLRLRRKRCMDSGVRQVHRQLPFSGQAQSAGCARIGCGEVQLDLANKRLTTRAKINHFLPYMFVRHLFLSLSDQF
jgi:hypothetical protein